MISQLTVKFTIFPLLATLVAAGTSPVASDLSCPLTTDFCKFTPDNMWTIAGGEAVTNATLGGTISSVAFRNDATICFTFDYRLAAVNQSTTLQVLLHRAEDIELYQVDSSSVMDDFVTASVDVPSYALEQQLYIYALKVSAVDKVHLKNFKATDGPCL